MVERDCDLCGGQVIWAKNRAGKCQKCGVVFNPPIYPLSDPNYTLADLLGPENYPSLCQ